MIKKRDRSVSLLVWTTVALFTIGCSAQAKYPPEPPQGPVRVQLLDAYAGLALQDTEVEVDSNDGIVGVTCVPGYPCGNHKTWSGRSDGAGVLTIPRSAIQFDTSVKARKYQAGVLKEVAIKDSSHIHPVELYPEWLDGDQYDWTRGYKLLDGHSGQALANTALRVEFPANDWPGQHGGITGFELKTNSLGYVFFSFLRKPEPKPGQILPDVGEAQWMSEDAWAIVSGYRKAKLNYFVGSSGDERSVIRLRQ